MKLKNFLAPFVLTCVLAFQAMAGEIEMPAVTSTPPPPPPAVQTGGQQSSDATTVSEVVETVIGFITGLFSTAP